MISANRHLQPVGTDAGLILLLVRLLYPKMRKRSGRLGGKGMPGSARSAILNYFSALEPEELSPLLELFLDPLSAAFRDPGNAVSTQDPFETARRALSMAGSDMLREIYGFN